MTSNLPSRWFLPILRPSMADGRLSPDSRPCGIDGGENALLRDRHASPQGLRKQTHSQFFNQPADVLDKPWQPTRGHQCTQLGVGLLNPADDVETGRVTSSRTPQAIQSHLGRLEIPRKFGLLNITGSTEKS